MSVRKTVKVVDALYAANYFLKESEDEKVAERRATASFLEVLLHKADAYAGYQHLVSAGVNYDEIAQGKPFKAVDESRRFYLYHKGLR